MNIPRLQDVKGLKGKRVLVRVGFNVPLERGKVVDGYRLKRALPTIEYLQKKGAKIILIAHIGRKPHESLKPIANYFNRRKNIKLGYVPDPLSKQAKTVIENMQNGSVVLLGNLRQYEQEKENDAAFAKELASLADIYVNDAFSVSHRKHASIVGIPKYLPAYAGLLFQDEIKHLDVVMKPKRPFLFILGGSKIQTKMPLLKKFAKHADGVFVGGAIANDLLLARGIHVGSSVTSGGSVHGLSALAANQKLMLPEDVLIDDRKNGLPRALNNIGQSDTIVDVGPKTRRAFEDMIAGYKFVVLNGPIGWYEKGYEKGTRKLLKVLSISKAKVIVGGGDTVALVSKMRLGKSFYFTSTGGGAMLDYLADGKLPGIDALARSHKSKVTSRK